MTDVRDGRCGPRASARQDPMLGTAFPATRTLLVEQPGGWGPAGLRASKFDSDIAEELVRNLGRDGIRIIAIRRPGRPEQSKLPLRRWAFADCRAGSRSMVWGEFDADSDLLDLPYASVGTPASGAAYLVCAHGTHDMCCAIEGRQVAAALEAVTPGNVWECSHLGGDRFAANVLVLPLGLQYGRIEPKLADQLVAATERGEVLPDKLRGQIGMHPAAQAALAFAQQELGIVGVDALRPLDRQATENGFAVRIATPSGVVIVDVRIDQRPPELLTCRAGAPKASVAYVPTGLTAEAPK